MSATTELGVDEKNESYDEDLAHWLQDVARRRGATPLRSEIASQQRSKTSSDDLINYLEELTGRKLTSREDINGFLKQFWLEEVEKNRAATRHRVIREMVLLGCLLVAYLQYYYWDVNLQIASLRELQVFVPASKDQYRVPDQSPKSTPQSIGT